MAEKSTPPCRGMLPLTATRLTVCSHPVPRNTNEPELQLRPSDNTHCNDQICLVADDPVKQQPETTISFTNQTANCEMLFCYTSSTTLWSTSPAYQYVPAKSIATVTIKFIGDYVPEQSQKIAFYGHRVPTHAAYPARLVADCGIREGTGAVGVRRYFLRLMDSNGKSIPPVKPSTTEKLHPRLSTLTISNPGNTKLDSKQPPSDGGGKKKMDEVDRLKSLPIDERLAYYRYRFAKDSSFRLALAKHLGNRNISSIEVTPDFLKNLRHAADTGEIKEPYRQVISKIVDERHPAIGILPDGTKIKSLSRHGNHKGDEGSTILQPTVPRTKDGQLGVVKTDRIIDVLRKRNLKTGVEELTTEATTVAPKADPAHFEIMQVIKMNMKKLASLNPTTTNPSVILHAK